MTDTAIVAAPVAQPVAIVDEHAVTTPFINTLSSDNPADKIATVNALNSSVSLNDYMDTPLKVVDVIQTPGVRKARQQGQVDTPCDNTYLITADGKSYMSQSAGVARSVRNLLAVFPDFNKENGGITVVCVEQKLANGNSLKQLTAQL